MSLALAVALAVAAPDVPSGACALLAAEDIRSVQSVPLSQAKASTDERGGLVFQQCFFATPDYVRSVSLSTIAGRAPDAARAWWTATFHGPAKGGAPAKAAATKKKDPPRAIPGVGDEAFWTGDARGGALYVLTAGTVLRISVGGVQDDEERVRRSVTLARAALGRLGKGGP